MTHIIKAFEYFYTNQSPLYLINEKCFYFQNEEWNDGKFKNGNNWCSHKFGYNEIMGHTHPIRNSGHQSEVNYYPSFEDIIYPIKNAENLINVIITPIGIYEAKYELKDYKIDIDPSFNKLITETLYPIYILTSDMKNNMNLEKIKELIGRNLIQHISYTCSIITNYINDNILTHFPEKYNYSLTFYPIINNGIVGLSRHIKQKIKKQKIKKQKIKKQKIKKQKIKKQKVKKTKVKKTKVKKTKVKKPKVKKTKVKKQILYF